MGDTDSTWVLASFEADSNESSAGSPGRSLNGPDPGMKDLLSYLIARDTMHQTQWLEALETLDDPVASPRKLPTGAKIGTSTTHSFRLDTRHSRIPAIRGPRASRRTESDRSPTPPNSRTSDVVALDPDPMTNNEANRTTTNSDK